MKDPILLEGSELIGRVVSIKTDPHLVGKIIVCLDGHNVTDDCVGFLGSQLSGYDRKGWVDLIQRKSDGGIPLAADGGGPLIVRKKGVVNWERKASDLP